jgi:hypothetical protein
MATTASVIAGVILSINTAVNGAGHFHSGLQRGFNTFAFFTIQSNLIVGFTSLLLAVKVDRSSNVFKVARLTGLVAIALTGVVYHIAIAHLLELDSWDLAGDQLVHTVVPILAVVGWLMFGPRGLTSGRIARLSLIFPIAWFAFTLLRGSIIHWYPYTFIDVVKLGYAKALINCFWISLLLLGLAGGATSIDGALSRSRGRDS